MKFIHAYVVWMTVLVVVRVLEWISMKAFESLVIVGIAIAAAAAYKQACEFHYGGHRERAKSS